MMKTLEITQKELAELAADMLEKGISIKFQAHGGSMRPFVLDGDTVTVGAVDVNKCSHGNIVLCRTVDESVVLHRIIRLKKDAGGALQALVVQGDAHVNHEDVIDLSSIIGLVNTVQRQGKVTYSMSVMDHASAGCWNAVKPLLKRIFGY